MSWLISIKLCVPAHHDKVLTIGLSDWFNDSFYIDYATGNMPISHLGGL